MISGFTFVHNALRVGIPIRESIGAVLPYVDEMVVVNAASDDGTREVLERMDVTIIDTAWGTNAGETLARLHAMNIHCKGDVIIHFEADEVFEEGLLKHIASGTYNWELKVWRIQVEQNFQRTRWYADLVHRVFEKGTVKKVGHTTDKHDIAAAVDPSYGYLWDVANCFRDNFLARIDQQARLWNGEPSYRMVPRHFTHPIEITREEVVERLKEPHWEWKSTPLNIPDILKPLVGKTKYDC